MWPSWNISSERPGWRTTRWQVCEFIDRGAITAIVDLKMCLYDLARRLSTLTGGMYECCGSLARPQQAPPCPAFGAGAQGTAMGRVGHAAERW